MDGETLLKTAADCADELPGTGLEHPFGDDWEVFKVCGKVFMLMTEVPGRPVVMLKSDPSEGGNQGPQADESRTPDQSPLAKETRNSGSNDVDHRWARTGR